MSAKFGINNCYSASNVLASQLSVKLDFEARIMTLGPQGVTEELEKAGFKNIIKVGKEIMSSGISPEEFCTQQPKFDEV